MKSSGIVGSTKGRTTYAGKSTGTISPTSICIEGVGVDEGRKLFSTAAVKKILRRAAVSVATGLLVIVGWALPALAGRPLYTEDAWVGPRGASSLETSFDLFHWHRDYRENIVLLVYTYGIADRLEMSVEFPAFYHIIDGHVEHSGVGDAMLSAKYRLWRSRNRSLQMTAKGLYKAATGDPLRGLGSGGHDMAAFLVLSYQKGRNVVHWNLGYTRVGNRAMRRYRTCSLPALLPNIMSIEESVW